MSSTLFYTALYHSHGALPRRSTRRSTALPALYQMKRRIQLKFITVIKRKDGRMSWLFGRLLENLLKNVDTVLYTKNLFCFFPDLELDTNMKDDEND